MRLQEEYFNRHKLVGVPLVEHSSHGALLLRTFDPDVWQSRWILLSIEWNDNQYHPGHYQVDFNMPIHDGHIKGRLFSRLFPTKLAWDEYEDFFLNWSRQLKSTRPVSGSREVVLCAWEMFVYCYDSWFLKQQSELKEMLFDSLDMDRTLSARYISYQDTLIQLSTHHPAVLKAWKYEVLAQVQHYSDWLVKLVESQCSTPRSK